MSNFFLKKKRRLLKRGAFFWSIWALEEALSGRQVGRGITSVEENLSTPPYLRDCFPGRRKGRWSWLILNPTGQVCLESGGESESPHWQQWRWVRGWEDRGWFQREVQHRGRYWDRPGGTDPAIKWEQKKRSVQLQTLFRRKNVCSWW